MTPPTIRMDARNYIRDETIPPEAYKTTAALGAFIDCIRRVTSCFACQPRGPDITEWRQILSLTQLLYAEVSDARLDELQRDRIPAEKMDYWFVERFDHTHPLRYLERCGDADMFDKWNKILDAYYSPEEDDE